MGGNLEDRLRDLLSQASPTPSTTTTTTTTGATKTASLPSTGGRRSPFQAGNGVLTDEMSLALAAGEYTTFVGHLVLKRASIPQDVLQQVAVVLTPPHIPTHVGELLAEIACKTANTPLSTPKAIQALLSMLDSPSLRPESQQVITTYFSQRLACQRGLADAWRSELNSWGQADTYLSFPKDGNCSLKMGAVPRAPRGYTVAMWFCMDEIARERRREPAALYRFSSGKPMSGTEVLLEYWGDDIWELTYRSLVPGSQDPSLVARTPISFTRGTWQLLTISHSLPYLAYMNIKKSQVRIMLDTHMIGQYDVPYPVPSAADQREAETFRHNTVAERFVGRLAGLTMYMDVLPDGLIQHLYRAGPNHPNLASPVPIPCDHVEDPVMRLGSEFCQGTTAEAGARVPISFSFHARWTRQSGSDASVLIPQVGTNKLDHLTLVKPGHFRAIGLDVSPLVHISGAVKLCQSDWSYETLAAVGGVRTILTLASDNADSAQEPAYLMSLLLLIAEFLSRHVAYREQFLQCYGFHVIASMLKKSSKGPPTLDTAAVDACLTVFDACGGEQGSQLFWAGIQGLFLDWDLWGRATGGTQIYLLERVMEIAGRNVAAFRECVGVQNLLDLLRLQVCASPNATPGGSSAAMSPLSGAQAFDMASATHCMPGSRRPMIDRADQIRLVEMCEPLLVAVIEHGFVSRPVIEGSWETAQEAAKADVQPFLRCLHETRSSIILAAVLRALTSIRSAHGDLLWRDLVRLGFDRSTCYLLLTRRGYSEDVRRLALDLFVWIVETAAATPGKLAAYVSLSEGIKDHGAELTNFDEHQASRAEEDVAAYAENFHKLGEVVSWLAQGVSTAVEAGGWVSRLSQDTIEVLAGEEDRQRPLWVILPFLAAILPLAPSQAQQFAMMKVNMRLKVEERSRKDVLTAGLDFWLTTLIAVASLGADDESKIYSEDGGGGMPATGTLSSKPPPSGGRGRAPDDWQAVQGFGTGAVADATVQDMAHIVEELALDALATLLHDEMSRNAGGSAGSSGDRAPTPPVNLWQRLADEISKVDDQEAGLRSWSDVALQRLCAMVLQRIARSGTLFQPNTMKTVLTLLSIIEERIFPLTLESSSADAPSREGSAGADQRDESSLAGVDDDFSVVGDKQSEKSTLSPGEVRLLWVICELVRYLRNGATATSSSGRLLNAESSYIPALLLSFRVLMALIGKMTASQAQSAVQELTGILYILLGSKSFDPRAASDMVMLLMAALRQAVDQMKAPDHADDELLQIYTALVISIVNDYAVVAPPPPVPSRGRSTSQVTDPIDLPCRQAVGRLLAPAMHEVSSEAIFSRLREPMDLAIKDFMEEQEDLLDRMGSEGYGMDSSAGKDESSRGLKRKGSHAPPVETRADQLTKDFNQQHRQALESEKARIVTTFKTMVEGFHAVDEYWQQVCRMTRWESRGLPPKPQEICWSLETEQGLLMARRRVLLTHSSFVGSQTPAKTKSRNVSPRSSARGAMEQKKMSLAAAGAVDGEKVGIALALQFGDKIRDVTTEAAAGKDDESKNGAWDVVDGGEFKGSKEEEKDLLEAPIPEMEAEYDEDEEDEEGDGKKGAAVRDDATKAAVVDMGLRTRDDRRLGGPERRTGHDGRPYHDAELMREDNVIMVTPRRQYRGTLVLTESYLYFFRAFATEDATASGAKGSETPAVPGRSPQFIKDEEQLVAEENAADGFSRERWVLANVTGVFVRRYRLRDTAMEVFFRLGRKRSVFIDFGRLKEDTARRDRFLAKTLSRVNRSAWKQWPRLPVEWLLKGYRITEAWQRREISNYDYLMALNTVAGRSFNDLSQYPVFPWILSNYTSPTIDLNDPANYRDLRKPMGALNEERLAEFMERYDSFCDPNIPKFMYGSHYSTAAGVVLHYLVRLEPYATLHREMQGGDFDVADRLFSSIPRSWRMNTSDLSEVKELTPEWFSMPDFLRNLNSFEMGETQDGSKVGDVELPPWAPTAEDFIRIQREALESEYVSQNLHHWIDLIFGFKQRGPAALEARNVFFYLTYYGAVDVSQIEDEALRMATEMQIAYFGQCPIQLFSRAHPAREPCPVIYRPLSSMLRQRLTVPTSAITPEQRNAWDLPEPVSVQEADSHVTYVKVLRNRILTVNENGVVSSYSWNCVHRNLERDRLAPMAGEAGDADGGFAVGLDAQTGGYPGAGTRGPSPVPRGGQGFYHLAANECVTSSTSSSVGSTTPPAMTPSHMADKASTPSDPSSPLRARRSMEEATSPARGAARADPRVQIMRLLVERDRTSIESIPRIPPSVFGERGQAFPIHISRTGRFVFGASDQFGSVHVIEMDVLEGKITGETTLQGHTAAVTCFASAEIEETGMELVLTGAKDCLGMLWCMQRIHAKTKKPLIFKRPDHIFYGHGGPIVSCALSASLGVALTASRSEVLVHSIDGLGLIRRISVPSALLARGFQLEHCLLSDEGFFVVTMALKAPDVRQPGTPSGQVARIQVWTMNGNIVTERETPFTIRSIKMVGRSNVVMVASREGSVDFYDLMDLDLVGSYRLDWRPTQGGMAGRASPTFQATDRLVCVDAGPDAATPVLLACGTSQGSLVVVGLPLLHHLRDLATARGFADTLLNVPIRIVKDTVNIALNTFGKARGIGTTVKGVAVEAFGEVQTLANDVRKKGISGLVGYFRQKL